MKLYFIYNRLIVLPSGRVITAKAINTQNWGLGNPIWENDYYDMFA